ncbi:MAG: O-antigen ligase family protein [Clostridiales bacterium]|nr:O-antigen ligase family protein [Clostridiales bacterium]
MKRSVQIVIASISLVVGIFGAFINPIIAIAGILFLLAVIIFITDYQRIIYLLSFFFIIDYVVRNFVNLPLLSSVWDEVFLLGALVLFIIKYIYEIKQKKHSLTPIDIPMLLFIVVNLFVLLANTTYIEVGLEGFRAVTTNLLWFFLVFSLIKDDKGAKKVLPFIISATVIIALFGVYQYVAGVEMPASWVDSAELGVRTRAFSVVQSPNVLGAIMTLASMISLGLFFYEEKIINKFFYALSFLIMVACLVFTLSRGAWIGFALAILVFVIIKDKRFILPIAALGIIVILFIPAISSRVLYMISPEYLFSSLTGGRAMRWINGFALFQDNWLLGVGLGHFGGAVAMHYPYHFPEAFYMDNYFLKIAVESGILGFLSFFTLITVTLSSIFKHTKLAKDKKEFNILLGIFSGLLGVSIHCFFENIFEVPGMIVFYWMIVAIAMAMIYKKKEQPL